MRGYCGGHEELRVVGWSTCTRRDDDDDDVRRACPPLCSSCVVWPHWKERAAPLDLLACQACEGSAT